MTATTQNLGTGSVALPPSKTPSPTQANISSGFDIVVVKLAHRIRVLVKEGTVHLRELSITMTILKFHYTTALDFVAEDLSFLICSIITALRPDRTDSQPTKFVSRIPDALSKSQSLVYISIRVRAADLRTLRTGIKGLDTKECMLRARPISGGLGRGSIYWRDADNDDYCFSIEARVGRHLLRFEKLKSVGLGYKSWHPY
ncbi:hypothetical protein KI688_006681 [Linnemannia hyalina]|uniref:Uncharacterized protein n=1 Tax=Linnemannia hyalina TaxID=64524 RepID=A0A9P7XL68_9FUNG|nr:hypothetical protein KI688_006681 [Linnemannia hyalina]